MDSGFLDHLASSFAITAPIVVVLLLGAGFRHRGWIDGHFVAVGNRLMYNACMPSLLFLATAGQPVTPDDDLPLAAFGVVATFVVVALLWLLAPLLVDRDKRGVFVHSAYRSNMGMIGIALCLAAYGEDVLARAGVFVAAMIATYNVLAVLVLTDRRQDILRNLVRNPLLLGVLAGIAWQRLGPPLPGIAADSLGYLSRMALPLALLCIGASLRWRSLRLDRPDVVWAAAFKMVIVPGAVTAAAVLAGFRGEDLGILFLMVAAPTAMVAFVMARALTPHGESAAETVALTTLVMPVTITLGLALLASASLV
ncbi:MAG: AEC family transporter [Xanthomonadales bacterium]